MADTAPPPHDLPAERAVLGAVLVHGRIPDEIVTHPSEFWRVGHQDIFTAMQRLHDRTEPIDLVTLRHELGDRLDEAGGPAYLYGLVDGVPRSTNAEFYADIVRKTWTARRALAVLDRTRAAIVADPSAATNGLAKLHAEQWQEITDGARCVTARAMTMPELTIHEFPPRRVLLTRGGVPVLRAGHLGEIHAMRGTGKTLFAQSLELAAATGTGALGFEAPEPCRVLRIDGEMVGEDLQSRYGQLRFALNLADTSNLTIVAADWQEGYLPRLDTPQGQAFVEPYIEAADFITIDNRSCLFDSEAEKDPTAWQPAQDWLLSLRRRGKAVFVIRHSNRMGGARGHSKSEDVIDISLKLSRPEDYRPDQGARFMVEFDKSRGIHGSAVETFTAALTSSGWHVEHEGDDTPTSTVEAKLREYVRLAGAAGEPPRSATAAISGAKVQKAAGLKAWALLLTRGAIRQEGGGFVLTE